MVGSNGRREAECGRRANDEPAELGHAGTPTSRARVVGQMRRQNLRHAWVLVSVRCDRARATLTGSLRLQRLPQRAQKAKDNEGYRAVMHGLVF